MNEKIKKEIQKLYEDGNNLLNDFKEGSINFSILRELYQVWYTKADLVVKEILPNRYIEFTDCYRCSKRKELTYSNCSMYDYLIEDFDDVWFSVEDAALVKFINQINIIKSINENIDNVLFNIKFNFEYEVLDDEINSSMKLFKKGFLRSAGALCGVVLEKHFSIVLNNHNLKLTKKEPTISDYNDLFKQENVYDTVTWRYIQHLGDIRNLCDHNKGREPTKEEVEDLINGTERVIKTIF